MFLISLYVVMTPYIYFLFSFHKLSYTGNNENLDNLKSLKISLTQCDIFFLFKVLICDVFFFGVCYRNSYTNY